MGAHRSFCTYVPTFPVKIMEALGSFTFCKTSKEECFFVLLLLYADDVHIYTIPNFVVMQVKCQKINYQMHPIVEW